MGADASRASTRVQFLKFLFVGDVNTAFGYSAFAALVISGMAPTPALVATYVVGILFNFVTTRRFVFGYSGASTFFRFVAAYGVIYVFNATLFELLVAAGIGPLVSQALCLPVVAVFSFFLFKAIGPSAGESGHGARENSA